MLPLTTSSTTVLIKTAHGAGIRSEGYGLPKGGRLLALYTRLKRLPLWGIWHARKVTDEVSAFPFTTLSKDETK